jgi:hypothetical protein
LSIDDILVYYGNSGIVLAKKAAHQLQVATLANGKNAKPVGASLLALLVP